MESKQLSCWGVVFGDWSVTAEGKSVGGDKEAALNGARSGEQTAPGSLQQLFAFSYCKDLSEQLLHASYL